MLSFLKKKSKPITKDSLIDLVEKEFTRRQTERRPIELQWRMNLAFIEGNQYIDINPIAMELNEIPPLFDWQEREVFNHIAPAVETRIAKLNRLRPILKVRPGTGDTEDVRAAKVGTMLLHNIYYDQGIQNLMSEIYAWMEICGSCLLKNIWDHEKGEIIGYLVNGELDKIENTEALREGDLDVIVCPPWEIFPDSNYRQNISDMKSLIHAKVYHIDEIDDIFNVKVAAENSNVMQLQRSMVGMGGLGYGLGGFQQSVASDLKDHAVVKEFHEIPTKDNPKGRLIIVAGKKLVHEGELPYPVKKDEEKGLSFTKVDCIERPGMFWGKSIVERLIPLQRRYNAIKNRKTEYMNRAAIGGFWTEEDSVDLDDMEQNIGAPGYIGVVKKGSRYPDAIRYGDLPSVFEVEEQNILKEFNALSGVSDLAKLSQAPPGVKSGVALSIASEQDDTRLSTVAANIEVFLAQNGEQWLRMYKYFVDGARTLREIGENNVVEVISFTGADIKSDDVVIEPLSAQIDSPAQRRNMVFELLSSGILNDPDTGKIDKDMRSKVFEMIQLGNWESADSEDQLHAAKAERENMGMANMQLATPAVYDEHIIHIKRHNKFRLTVEYEEMMQQNPFLEQIFQAHVDGHLMFLVPPQAQAPEQINIAPPEEVI